MTDTLKDCPFCGDAEDVHASGDNSYGWTVQCDNCTGTMGYCSTEAEAIAAWNTRPAERVPEEVRRLYRSEKDQMAKALDANRSDVFIRASNRERTIREVVHTIYGPEGVKQLEAQPHD